MALSLGALGCALFFNGRHIELYAYAGVLVFAAFSLTMATHARARVSIGPPGSLLLAFFLWNALATTWSSVPYVSIIELGILISAIEVYLIWRVWNADHPALPTRFLLIAFGIGLGSLMIGQYFVGLRPHATLLNPNSAAGFLNFLWPFAALVFPGATAERRVRWLAIAATFLMMFALLLDGSRGALLGALVALAIVGFAGLAVLRERRATLIVFGTFIAALVTADFSGGHATTTGAASLADPSLAGTSRFVIWQAAWDMVREQPWLGYGPGVFWLAYASYRSPHDSSTGLWVHNDYLEFWIETGVIGLALAIGLGIACLAVFMAAARQYKQGERRSGDFSMAAAGFAGIAAVAAHSFFTFNLQMLPFVLVLGIVLAELERGGTAKAWLTPRVPSFRRMVPAIGLAALALLVVGHFARTAIAFDHSERGAMLMRQGDYIEAASTFTRAQGIWSQLDASWYLNANVLLEAMRANAVPEHQRRELVVQAEAMLDRAEYYNPHRAATPLIRGLLRADHPELTSGSAQDALRRAVELDPRNIEARYALSQLLERAGEHNQARVTLERGLEIANAAGIDGSALVRRLNALDSEPSSSGTAPIRRPSEGTSMLSDR